MNARWSVESDWDRVIAEHTHGAWCHPSAEGCPEVMRPQTPTEAEGRGRTTRLRGAHRAPQPPRPDSTAWWVVLAFVLAMSVIAYQLWSLS